MPQKHFSRREEVAWWVIVLILLAIAGWHLYWMRTQMYLPLWAAVLILLPGAGVWGYALIAGRFSGDDSEVRPRKGETAIGVVMALGTLYLGIHAANYCFLIYLYGLPRVRAEHLHFLATPKGHPWLVSNGDAIYDDKYLHFLIAGEIWFAIFFVTYPLIHHLLPVRKK